MAIIDYLLKPFCNYLVTFYLWGQYMYDFKNGDNPMRRGWANKTVSVMLLVYAAYFGIMELS